MIHRIQKAWDTPFDLLREIERTVIGRDEADNDEVAARYPVDIFEDEDGLTVSAELPGFAKNQVELSVENNVLTIAAQRDSTVKHNEKAHLHERRFVRTRRQFTLPDGIDTTDIDAALADGVLTLRLTKKAEIKSRKIEVK